METGRIRRSARRGIAVAVLGWLGVAAFAVLMAPSAAAAPTATVPIRDVTVPAVSVDAGGTVTFVNEIQDKTVQVGGGGLIPSLVSVTAKTEVGLRLPSGTKALAPGASVAEKFASSCVNCVVTFTYRLSSNASLTQPLTDAALGLLPALPAPTPFVVNTLVPLPNLGGVNVPQLPPVTVPNLPGVPAGGPQPPTTLPTPGGPVDQAPTPGGPTGVEGVPGSQYTYNTGSGAPQLSPASIAAASAFDPSRFYVPGRSLGGPDRNDSANGSGGVAGSYDGASVPVFGQLAGLDGAALDDQSAQETASSSSSAAQALPAAALAAVVALAAVTAALVRTHQASRSSR
ncbi:hypothetical protein [Blastococcus sp. CT_GayMR16]|uniref:hypothetical protein n=1 Tax=Blastococcus sp. CT_GayMR16 TaxID=2559607 RepID=UPI001073A309|nr:hypothetical protein [Blastococcus sp. CT_GayMR16]TFV88004.1 hypothetical protein E4P38_12060 [Blastococcus sp. CT_GayMR16]